MLSHALGVFQVESRRGAAAAIEAARRYDLVVEVTIQRSRAPRVGV